MRLFVAISLVALLGGCATAYQPEGLSGGFSETQLDTNVFRISFRGNEYSHAEEVEELALLRSAELTLIKGFTHFVVIDLKNRERTGAYTTPAQSYTTANVTAYGNTAYGTTHTTNYGGQTFHTSEPSATNTIMCFNGKPDIQGLIYDAHFVCNSLGKKHEVACGSVAR